MLTAVVVAVLVLSAMPFLLPEAPVVKSVEAVAAPRTKLFPKDLHVWLLGFLALFSMVPEGAVLDWAAIYLQKELGADVFVSGLGFAFFAGAMAVMRFMGDSVRNRFGAVRTLRVSGLLGAAGLMGGALAPNDWFAIASFAVAAWRGEHGADHVLGGWNHPSLRRLGDFDRHDGRLLRHPGRTVLHRVPGGTSGLSPNLCRLSLLLVLVALCAARAADADGAKVLPVAPGQPA